MADNETLDDQPRRKDPWSGEQSDAPAHRSQGSGWDDTAWTPPPFDGANPFQGASPFGGGESEDYQYTLGSDNQTREELQDTSAWTEKAQENQPSQDTALEDSDEQQLEVFEPTHEAPLAQPEFDVAAELFSDDDTDLLWNPTGTDFLNDTPSEYTTQTSFRDTPDEHSSLYSTPEDTSWLGAANDVTNRYLFQDDYYELMTEILGLGVKGDLPIQNVIRDLKLTRDPDIDAQQRATYEAMLAEWLPKYGIHLPNDSDAKAIIDMAYDELLGIGPLGPLWRDENVTDILVNGPYQVNVERNGALISTPVRFRDLAHLQGTARRLSTLVDDRGVSRTNPIVTVQLERARVQLVWEPIAVEGASVSIRKHREQLTLAQLTSAGALSTEMVAFLADAVASRATVLVSGATGSGKTTYLNVLSGFIPHSERVLVIEDARELKLENKFVEYMLTKQAATVDDAVVIGFDKLLEAALRMRPDRIVVGEILSAQGAKAMLDASFTGHDGTMTTLHANNPSDALVRISGLLREASGMPEDLARQQVNRTFNLIVQVSRDILTGVRLVKCISTVTEDGVTEDIFRGKVNPDKTTTFTRVAALSPGTDLAQRMRDCGVDMTVWENL